MASVFPGFSFFILEYSINLFNFALSFPVLPDTAIGRREGGGGVREVGTTWDKLATNNAGGGGRVRMCME